MRPYRCPKPAWRSQWLENTASAAGQCPSIALARRPSASASVLDNKSNKTLAREALQSRAGTQHGAPASSTRTPCMRSGSEQLAHASLRPAGAPKASTACFRANWLRFRGPTGRPHRLQGIHPLVVFGCVAEGGDKKACFKASKAEGRECSSTASRDSQNSLAAGSSAKTGLS